MDWQDAPVVDAPTEAATSGSPSQSVGSWESAPATTSPEREQYLRDKYAWGLSAPLKGIREEYSRGAIKEVTDPIEQQFLASEVAKISKANEWAQTEEYNKSGFLKKFGKNLQKVTGRLYEGYREVGTLPKKLVGAISESPEQVRFARALEASMQGENPSAETAPGISGEIAGATAGMFPMIQTAGVAGGAGSAGAAALGASARVASLAGGAASAAVFAPGMYENTYGALLDKGVSPSTAKWTAAASATLQSALFARLPKAIFPKLGGEEAAAKTITEALVKNYGKAVLVEGAGTMAGATAIDSTAKELAGWAEGKGAPDAVKIIKDSFAAYKSAVGPMAILAGPRAAGEASGVLATERQKMTKEEILLADASGEAPSRKQWERWGMPADEGLSRRARSEAVKSLAEEIRAEESKQVDPAVPPAEEVKPTEEIPSPVEPPSGEVNPTEVSQPPAAVSELAASPSAPESASPVTSIKNSIVDELRAGRGDSAIGGAPAESKVEWLDRAEQSIKDDPTLPDRLVDGVTREHRSMSDEETAVMQIHYRRLNNAFESASDKLFSANESGDPVAAERAQKESNLIFDQMRDVEEASRIAGREWGRSGVARQIELLADFSPATLVRRARVAKGGAPLTPEEGAKVKEMGDKIIELQRKLDDHNSLKGENDSNKAVTDAISKMAPKKSFRITSAKRAEAQEKVKAAWDELKSALSGGTGIKGLVKGESGALNLDAVAAVAKLAKAYVDLKTVTFSEFMAHAKQHLGAEADKSRDLLRAAWERAKEEGGVRTPEVDPNNQGAVSRLARKITRSMVEAGVTELEAVVDAVHEELGQIIPDITRRKTMDAISGYGQHSSLSKDAASASVRDITRKLRQLAKLEEKKGGSDVTDPETQLKTALDKAKSAVRNRIADLEEEIRTRQKIVRNRTELTPDSELLELQKQRDELRVEHAEVFPKQPATEEQKIAVAGKALDRSITQLESDLKTGAIGFKKRPGPISTPELDAKRAKLEELRSRRQELRDAANPKRSPEEIKTAEYKRSLLKSLSELQRRISERDFSKKEVNKSVPDKESLDIKYRIEQEKLKFRNMVDVWNKSQRTALQKSLAAVPEALNFSRAVLTSMDLSAVLRQGGFAVASHPILAAKALPEMFKAFASRRGEFAAAEELRNRPNARLYEQSKLAITVTEGRLSAQEEQFMGTWAKKIPGVAGSERAYVTFLNRMRADVFDSMTASLSKSGGVTVEEAKAVANFVNVATGRGNLGAMAGAAAPLATVFFSPRYVVSRFQLLLGQPLWKGDARTRALVATEYARALIGIGTFYGISAMSGAFSSNEDDKPKFEFDPRSSDFGKVRFGDFRVDPLAGLSQTTVMAARLIGGKTKASTGEVVPIRGDKIPWNGMTSPDVIAKFLRGKLSPWLGSAVDIVSGENIVGEKTTPFSVASRSLLPLSFRDVYDAILVEGIPKKTALSMVVILGMGAQNYEGAGAGAFAKKIAQHAKLIGVNKKTGEVFDNSDQVSEVISQAKKLGITEGELSAELTQKMKLEGHKSDAINEWKRRIHKRFNAM